MTTMTNDSSQSCESPACRVARWGNHIYCPGADPSGADAEPRSTRWTD